MRVRSFYRRPYRIAAFCGRIKARTRIIPSFIVINKRNSTSLLNKRINRIRVIGCIHERIQMGNPGFCHFLQGNGNLGIMDTGPGYHHRDWNPAIGDIEMDLIPFPI